MVEVKEDEIERTKSTGGGREEEEEESWRRKDYSKLTGVRTECGGAVECRTCVHLCVACCTNNV